MVGITLLLACLFSIVALTRKNGGEALGILIMSMLVWPEYLRIPTGIVEFSIPRMVGLFIIFKYNTQGNGSRFIQNKVDILVLLLWVWTAIATALAGGSESQVTQMIGRGLDTAIMYFAAKLTLRTESDINGLFKYVGVTALVVGGMGAYEAFSGYSIYKPLLSYRTWSWIIKPDEYRLGFLRAKGSTSVHIYFGMAMVMILGLVLGSYSQVNRLRGVVFASVALLGVFSSLSSGPWMAALLLIFFVLLINRPRLIRPFLVITLSLMVVIEMFSNRHFYNIIDYIALDKTNAWYRTRIIEVAFQNYAEFIWFGMGSDKPHHWGMQVDGRAHVDIVNNYVMVTLYGGILALVFYLTIHYKTIKSGFIVSQDVSSPLTSKRFLVFALATLLAIDISSMSVGLYGPALILSYILLGCINGIVLGRDAQVQQDQN